MQQLLFSDLMGHYDYEYFFQAKRPRMISDDDDSQQERNGKNGNSSTNGGGSAGDSSQGHIIYMYFDIHTEGDGLYHNRGKMHDKLR